MSRSDWAISDSSGNFWGLSWYCPGCDLYHAVPVKGGSDTHRTQWDFDGNWDAPTIAPSVLVNSDTPRGSEVSDKYQHRCHVFIRNGRIQFLRDCTHHLAGQTVPLPKDDPWHTDEEE